MALREREQRREERKKELEGAQQSPAVHPSAAATAQQLRASAATTLSCLTPAAASPCAHTRPPKDQGEPRDVLH